MGRDRSKVEPDVRSFLENARDERRADDGEHRIDRADPEDAVARGRVEIFFTDRIAQIGESARDRLREGVATLGRLEAVWGFHEKRIAERRAELAERGARRRLGETELPPSKRRYWFERRVDGTLRMVAVLIATF